MKKFCFAIAVAVTGLVLTGCIEPAITNTSRSAVEQILLATVVERGIERMDFSSFSGKNAFIDYKYLAPQTDKEYVQAVLETHLAASGITVVAAADKSDVTIRPYCGVLATTSTSFNIGTPSLPIPIPNTDFSFAVPELSLIKRINRSAYSRFSVAVYDSKTTQLVHTECGLNDRSVYNDWTILFFLPFTSRDVEVGEHGRTTWRFFER